jgi:hypothetical protein
MESSIDSNPSNLLEELVDTVPICTSLTGTRAAPATAAMKAVLIPPASLLKLVAEELRVTTAVIFFV